MFAFRLNFRDAFKRSGGQRPTSPLQFGCPICDDPMIVVTQTAVSADHPTDAQVRELKCDNCGMMADRVYHPKTGYRFAASA